MNQGDIPPCSRCLFLRGFLVTGFGIILLMALRPEGLERLAPLLPGPEMIAAAVPLLGVPAFLARWLRWRRTRGPSEAARAAAPEAPAAAG